MIFSRFSAYIRLALFLIAFVVTLWVQLSEHIESASTLEVIKLLIGFGLFVVISIIGAIAAIQDWYRKGRDWHWSKPRILDDSQDAKLRGIQPKEANVREFHPPENMSPVLNGIVIK